MKFTTNRLALYLAFKTAAKIIPANAPIESIKGLLLEVSLQTGLISITGTDIRTRIQKRVPCDAITENGEMVVSSKLCDILRLMPGDTVSFETDFNGQLKICSGQCEYTLPIRSSTEFPKAEFDFPEQMVSVTGLNALVRHACFAAEARSDTANSVTQAVELALSPGKSVAAATNGNRMAIASNNGCADGTISLLIHNAALQALVSLIKAEETLFCGISQPYAVFFTQDTVFATILMQGAFPDMRKIMTGIETSYRAAVQAKEFLSAIETAAVCQLSGDDSCVNLKIAGDRIIIVAEAYKRKSEIPVQAVNTVPTDETGFYYAPRYITDFLKLASDRVELCMDKRGFLRLETSGMQYVVCPRKATKIHIPADKKEKPEPKKKKSAKKAA